MSRPLVAIVGRPNVGKSMLFNKLCGRRLSIVEDTPGVTRDRLYAECEWCGRKFDMVDTGGIEPTTDSEILLFMREQAQLAINAADVIVLVTEIGTGVTAADRTWPICSCARKSPSCWPSTRWTPPARSTPASMSFTPSASVIRSPFPPCTATARVICSTPVWSTSRLRMRTMRTRTIPVLPSSASRTSASPPATSHPLVMKLALFAGLAVLVRHIPAVSRMLSGRETKLSFEEDISYNLDNKFERN